MRRSGILMPITSLPSPYGIGTLGQCARDFICFLEKAGQTYWQILPIGPTGYGDSPYQSFSAFAGNPYRIDLDLLLEQGLLTEEELTFLYDLLNISQREEIPDAIIRAVYGSVADIVILQMQDILKLGNEARMNSSGH